MAIVLAMRDWTAAAAFVLAILGASYQLIAYQLAPLVDNRAATYLFSTFYSLTILTNLVAFWAASHPLGSQDGRGSTWSAIILAVGVTSLTNLIIEWYTPSGFVSPQQSVPVDVVLTVIPAPILLILGSFFGFASALRQRRPTLSQLGHVS